MTPAETANLETDRDGRTTVLHSVDAPAAARQLSDPPPQPLPDDVPLLKGRTRDPNRQQQKLSAREESLLYGGPHAPSITYPQIAFAEQLGSEDRQARTQLTATSGTLTEAPIAKRSVGVSAPRAGIRRAVNDLRFQVGLDFGTSATKVMYRQVGGGQRAVRALEFRHGLSDYPHCCIPSAAAFDRSGNLLLGASAIRAVSATGWGTAITRFKMLLAGSYDAQYLDKAWNERFREHVVEALGDVERCTPQALTATYLAFVMRSVRNQLRQEFGSATLDLVFNTCVPVDQREKPIVYAAFERAIAVAQEIERDAGEGVALRVWLDRATELWDQVSYDPNRDSTRVFLVEEAVAASAGYISSVRREAGLHAIVDIGAGTTDVSIFRLERGRRTAETAFWYAGRSIPMGAAWIEAMIAERLRQSQPNELVTQTMVQSALSGDSALAKSCSGIIRDELTRMWNGTNKAWSEAYGHDRRESSWRTPKVRVFISGGGALIPIAKEVFREAWIPKWGPYPCDVIPTPEDFDGRSVDAPFARLCVAFGLAIPLPEIGHHVRPSKSPDHTSPAAPRRDHQRDGDQLVPRPGWT